MLTAVFSHATDWAFPSSWAFGVDADGRYTVMIKCPNEHILAILDHKVNPEGLVIPSVMCPADGCNFHAHIILGGWDGRIE